MADTVKARIHIKVNGLVQGVFFRASTEKKAGELGLTGWVKNCDDGSVEIMAEGKKDALQKLYSWACEGSESARVDGCKEEWGEYKGEFSGFRIVY